MLSKLTQWGLVALSPAHWWKRVLLAVFLVAPLLTWLGHQNELQFEVEWQIQNEELAQVFYDGNGQGFSAEQVVNLTSSNDGRWQNSAGLIRGSHAVAALRFDPAAHPGALALRRFSVTGPGGSFAWEGQKLQGQALQQLEYEGLVDGAAKFLATGDDPQFQFGVPPVVTQVPWSQWWWQGIQTAVGVALAWLVLEGLSWWARRNCPWLSGVWRSLDRLGQRFSDEQTIVFKASSVTVLLAIVVFAFAFVALKLHQSSIARWDGMYGVDRVERWVDLGSAKAIRSDEWNTQTPWVLNQVQRGMPLVNSNVGGAESAFVASTPVLYPTMVAQPKYWGFLLFDIERGFSWVWAYKLFGLLASFFLLFLFLTRGDTVVSAAGALWVWGSSFVQWWFSSNLPELLIGFAAGLTGALYLTQARRTGGMLFGAVLFVFSVATLLLHVYPAFIIPLAYLGAFVLFAWLLRPDGLQVVQYRGQTRAGIALFALFCAAGFAGVWASVAADTIGLMSNTLYPGRRYHLGGSMPLDRLFYGFFEAMRNSEVGFPLPPSNASEASSFLLLFPLVLVLVNPLTIWSGQRRVLGGVLAYCLFVLMWMSFPLPAMVRELWAATGWSMSTSNRAEVGLGIGSILLVTVLASHLRTGVKQQTNHLMVLALALGVGAVVAVWGLWLRRIDPEFFFLRRLALGTACTMAIALALAYRSRWGFLAAIGLFVLPAIAVNPLQSGLASLLDKPVLNRAVQVGGGAGDRWAVVGSFVFSQGLKARGLDVVTGTHYTPNLPWLQVLDPAQRANAVWNRYAHVTYESMPGTELPEFVLVGADQYTVRFDLCSGVLATLGVNRVAYTVDVPPEDLACLEPLEADVQSGVKFFQTR